MPRMIEIALEAFNDYSQEDAAFENCVEMGGEVRRVSGPDKKHGLKEGEYVNYCFLDGQSHRGEIKKTKVQQKKEEEKSNETIAFEEVFPAIIGDRWSSEDLSLEWPFGKKNGAHKKIQEKRHEVELLPLSKIAGWLYQYYGEKNAEGSIEKQGDELPLKLTMVINDTEKNLEDVDLVVEASIIRDPEGIVIEEDKGNQYLKRMYRNTPRMPEHVMAEGIFYSHEKEFREDLVAGDRELAPGIYLAGDTGRDIVLVISRRDRNYDDPSKSKQRSSTVAVTCHGKVGWEELKPYFEAVDEDAKKKFEQRKYRSIVFY